MKASTLAKLTEITRDDYLIALNDPAGSPAGRAVEWGLISGELGQARLKANTSVGATTCSLDTLPKGAVAGCGWLVFDPFTVQCEIRKWAGGSKATPTFAALSYAHSADDPVLWVTEPVANVKWFGARGDGITDDTAAIQAAMNTVSSFSGGVNKYSVVYLPRGKYKVTSSLNMTNRRFFMIRGDGWGLSQIVSYATGKAVIDMLGTRDFDLRDFTISGDSNSTPSVGLFFGRTTTAPNCGTCFIDSISLDGKFSAAGIYNIRGEVFVVSKLRSGDGVDTPWIYYLSNTNDLSVTSDYETLDFTYEGSSQQFLHDWFLNTYSGGTYNSSGIHLGPYAHSSFLKNIYYNLYGGTGYALVLKGNINGLSVDGLTVEGSCAGIIKLDAAHVQQFTFRNVGLYGFTSVNGSILNHGIIENSTGVGDGGTVTFETLENTKLRNWWTYWTEKLTIGSARGNYLECPEDDNVTITTDNGGNIIHEVYMPPNTLTTTSLRIRADGSTITRFVKATASVDFPSIPAGSEGQATVALTGAAWGDLALASPRTGLLTGLVIKQVVAEPNLIRIYLYNYSAAAIDETAQEWTVAAIK